jgi:hypothetical protein
VNDIFELDHLATDDDTNEIYRLDDTGLPVKLPNVEEWENAPVDEISVEDINEATALEESKRNYLVDRTPDGELDYDNKKFSLHIIKYLLPKGGFVYYDESRHYVENEYLIPIYASIHTVTFLTSDPMYSSSIIIIFILLLSFVIVATKTKEKWVHRHNISVFSQRKSLPLVKSSQAERVRWAILNKARMSKGLSPEEFKDLSPAAIDDIIKDQQLIDLVRNPNRTFTEEEFKVIIEKTTKFGK